jgi:endonuclease/exonuclease/phosphatase (EEP) superfamily protein YafD
VAVLGLWALLRWADEWWPATLLMFGPRWVLAGPALVLVPAAVFLRRRSLVVLLVALAVILGPVMGLCLPWRSALGGPSDGDSFRVLTWNAHYRRPNGAALRQFIGEARPDLAVFQNWHTPSGPTVFSEPGWHVQRNEGMFLASRYPITAVTVVGQDSMAEDGDVVRYELATPIGPLYLFNLHLATPRHGIQEVFNEGRQGAAGVQENSDLRERQAERLSAAAEQVAGPLLLAGDFNTPAASAIYRRYWDRYTDAFETAGWGCGYTFISRRSQVRIDHILAGPGWGCSRCWLGPDLGSPHLPVIADLVWAE